ncbi:HDOD domain-containing protein [bacterium]|nr:HDOD domain-containing protein [bacterium]
MSRSEYRRVVSAIDELPTLPAVAIRVIDAACDEDPASLREIAAIVESDPALASKLLKFANSSMFHFEDVHTVSRAISLLGTRMVRNLALSVGVFNIFGEDKGEVEGFSVPEFWRHAAASALIAQKLAERLGYGQPEEAFLGGLIHDVGKIAMYHCMPEELARVMRAMADQRRSMISVEQELLGTDHTELGKWVAQKWRLPQRVIDPIWLHHQPLAGRSRGELCTLPFFAQFSDVIVNLYRIGTSGNDRLVAPMEPYLRATGLTEAEIDAMVQDTVANLNSLAAMFGLSETTAELYLSAVRRANAELGRIGFELDHRLRALEISESTLKVLCDFLSATRPEDEINSVLTQAVRAAHQAFKARWVICLAIEPEEEMLLGKRLDAELEVISELRLPIGGDLSLEAVEESGSGRVSLLERTLLSDPNGARMYSEIMRALQSTSLVISPLLSGRRVIGELLLDLGPLSVPARQHLSLLTSMIASALDRCVLYEGLSRKAEDLARAGRKVEEAQVQMFHNERLASVGRLAAGAAHEINNPLAVISGKAQMLARIEDDAKRQADLRTIVEQTKRISRIINDLMGFARPPQPELKSTDIPEVIRRALSLVQNRISLDNIQVVQNFSADLPRTVADPHQLEQVFLNLLINAEQAMPKGGKITITAGRADDPAMIEVSFADTGAGIDPEHLKHIFDPFFTTKEEGKGTGLGLAICHSIIESHGGRIEVRSRPGQGAVFTIRLPIDQGAQIRAIQSDLKRETRRKRAARHETYRLLVIDDEADLREILTTSFRDAGYEVETAANGMEGLEFLAGHEVDCVLLDIRMPKKDGLEVLSAIRNNLANVPVVVITGLASSEQINEAMELGAFAVLRKPFDIGEVMQTAEAAIKAARKQNGAGGGAA